MSEIGRNYAQGTSDKYYDPVSFDYGESYSNYVLCDPEPHAKLFLWPDAKVGDKITCRVTCKVYGLLAGVESPIGYLRIECEGNVTGSTYGYIYFTFCKLSTANELSCEQEFESTMMITSDMLLNDFFTCRLYSTRAKKGTVTMKELKIEKGSTATPWVPAPEDLAANPETPVIVEPKPLDWGATMQQTFEYYTVDPNTWLDKDRLLTITKSSIERDSDAETLGSATIEATESFGECYVRTYLVTVQNGIREKHPLGTHLIQTPSTSYDGLVKKITMDAYTPLLELKENPPPLGYSILKNANVMNNAYVIARENMRGPVVPTSSSETLYDNFVANTDDTWLSFLTDLITNDKKHLDIDEMGRVLFAPDQELESLQPVWTYTDDNSSILYPDISMDHDLYGIPNVVEVIYSNNGENRIVTVKNEDENSPTSIVNRGREILYRDTNPNFQGTPTNAQLEVYAKDLLKSLSTVEYAITYSHGYCPVRLGDCVRLNYKRANMYNIKAKVIKQSIDCSPGCKVTETAKFTTKLWAG